jgi:hypothetical protein
MKPVIRGGGGGGGGNDDDDDRWIVLSKLALQQRSELYSVSI